MDKYMAVEGTVFHRHNYLPIWSAAGNSPVFTIFILWCFTFYAGQLWVIYSETCLKRPLKIKVLKTSGSLVQVKSIAEMLQRSILQYFLPALSDYRSRKHILGSFFEWPLKTGFNVCDQLARLSECWTPTESGSIQRHCWLCLCQPQLQQIVNFVTSLSLKFNPFYTGNP